MAIGSLVLFTAVFVIGLLSYGWLAAIVGQARGSKRRGLFWLGFLAYGVIQPVLFLGGSSIASNFDYASRMQTLLFVLSTLPSLIFPLVLLTAILLRAKYKRQPRSTAVRGNAALPVSPEAGMLQPPQAVLEPEERKVEAASELVNVPEGVTIRVKRAHTVQHTISVNWSAGGDIQGKGSLVKLIELTITATIERSKETSYQESETIEYEVELNGNKSQGYKLVWMDVWRQGKVELETKDGKHSIPFEYRERSELDVIPVENK
jgi:hypothetical protein